ncbi:MAG: BatD family protein, partial [Bacteroidetes bacterium]|nr:BatD family protein [Bacteroidota bacterium]
MKKVLIILFLFLPLDIFAQSFVASVGQTTVADNQHFEVSFTFSSKDIKGVRNFKPPAFRNYLVLSGPNQSTSIQIMNGIQSASLSYNYIIQAKRIGTFSIGTASIEYNGES